MREGGPGLSLTLAVLEGQGLLLLHTQCFPLAASQLLPTLGFVSSAPALAHLPHC